MNKTEDKPKGRVVIPAALGVAGIGGIGAGAANKAGLGTGAKGEIVTNGAAHFLRGGARAKNVSKKAMEAARSAYKQHSSYMTNKGTLKQVIGGGLLAMGAAAAYAMNKKKYNE